MRFVRTIKSEPNVLATFEVDFGPHSEPTNLLKSTSRPAWILNLQ